MMYRSKVYVQELWYFVPGLDIQPEQSKNYNPAQKKAVAGCKTQRLIYSAFLNPCLTASVVAVSPSRSKAGDLGSIPAGC